jgi:activator of 2-hydroxyglutaryl-CoA dehydratase
MRVLVEHRLCPPKKNYSSFSELVIIARAKLKVDYSKLLFDNQDDIISEIKKELSEQFNTSYYTAEGSELKSEVREIIKIEEVLDNFNIPSDFIELDERLYTFGEKLTFEEFRERYQFGMFAD